VNHWGLNYPPTAVVITTHFQGGGALDGFPTRSEIAVTEGAITRTNTDSYYYFYDGQDRLEIVGRQSDHIVGDYEYDLEITYDDRSNAAALSYVFTTGPRQRLTIAASGYDDKPNPFVGIPFWYRVMHAAWDNYDPDPVFTALSKNNLLGFTLTDGTRRETAYTYDANGYPTSRRHTNTNASGSVTFDETFEYVCP
jgi:YD repeat-containing protein